MKKTYSNPELEVVMLNMNQQLLAGSTLGTDSSPVDPNDSDAPGFVEIDEMDIFKNM